MGMQLKSHINREVEFENGYSRGNFLYSMLVKTFSRLYFFAFFIVFAIYISDNSLQTRDKMQSFLIFNWLFFYFQRDIEASFSVFFPFIFTYVVVSLREMYFEQRRGKKDKMVNSQACTIIRKFREENPTQGAGFNRVSSIQTLLNTNQLNSELKTSQKVQIYQHIKWEDLKIGDIVLLKKDDICPADILILDMFDYQCTVNTQNIDDKSDEKIKTASELMFLPKNSKIKGNHVEYRKLLTGKFSFKGFQDSFKGLVKLKKDPIAQELTPDQFIMRGSRIQFTEWILGLVIEIGMQTYIYRKFKRPKIIYYNSTFMRKQFMFSAVTILIILVLIFFNLAFTEINECLKGGFIKYDAKLIISALLHLPVYYHAVSEFLISLYCIYINYQDSKKEDQLRKKTASIDASKSQKHLHISQNQNLYHRQNSEINSHVHLKKEAELLKDENFNTIAALKTSQDEKSNYVKIDDCLQQMNDTRSIVDMCLTTHLVFNTANTLTTGQCTITGLLIQNNIYHVDITHLKTLVIRRNSKKDTLINLQQSLQYAMNRHGSAYQNQGITPTANESNTGKQRSAIPSIALSSSSQNNLLLNMNHLSNANINIGGANQHNYDLERVVEESRFQENNSKGNNPNTTDSKLSTPELENIKNSQIKGNLQSKTQSNFNRQHLFKKKYSLVLQPLSNQHKQEESDVLNIDGEQNQAQVAIKRENHRSATNLETNKDIQINQNILNIEEEHFMQPSITNMIPLPLIKNNEKDGEHLQIQNEIQNLLTDTPYSKQKEDQFFMNNIGDDSNKNINTLENKITSMGLVQNDIEIEMHSIKGNNQSINQTKLIHNKNFENFVNSLEFHKQNNHKIPQLIPKKISDIDSPFPESDGEVSSPRRAKKIVKLNRSTDYTINNVPKQLRSTDGTNKTSTNMIGSRNQISEYLRSTVAKGVKKTLNKNEEQESNTNTQGSGKSTQQNKYRAGSSTLRSLANQLNGGIDVSSILETKDFVNIYLNEDSESYYEVQDILKSMLLCHYTRSFYDEDSHKITNRSFYHIEELQLQLGSSIGFSFEFSCYIDGEFYYVLKKDKKYYKYKILAYHYYTKLDRFCILIEESPSVYSIYIKEEITNISSIGYLNENVISDLNSVCNYYRYQGNRTVLYCKKEISQEGVNQFITKMEHKQNLSLLFNHELNSNVQYLTLIAVKEQTVSGLDTFFRQLKEAKIKSWIATGEKQSKVVPICFSAGLLDKMHRHIAFESDEYDKLAFQIRNMLQQLKDGFQKAYNTQKQGSEFISNLNINSGSNIHRDSSNEIKYSQWQQPGSSGVNGSRKILQRQKSQSTTKHVRQTSRKSIVSGMELENQFRFSILVSGKSFKEILNSSYLYNHFSFICYFAQSVVGYDMTPELKAQLIKVINVKMNQNYKTMFVGDTLADFQAFTDSNISAHKKSSFNETQNYPGIQFDRIENILQLLLFHSKMVAEICEDALYFNLYRGILFIFVLVYQFQMCDIDHSMINLGTMLFLSFFIIFVQTLIIVYKKYRKYQKAQLNTNGLISQFGILKSFSNQHLLFKTTKLIFIIIVDSATFYFFIHFLISQSTTLDGQTLSMQFTNYLEQYFALAVIPFVRLFLEYRFKFVQAIIFSFLLLAVPLLAFSFDPNVREQIRDSFQLLKEPQYVLSIFFIPFFMYGFNLISNNYMMIKSFPLIKSYQKLARLIKDCIRESFFIKPKQFNIAKLIREIFLTYEPDIILSSYILSEQVNLREASMDKWTLKFKDQNVEARFLSQYKKKSLTYSKTISTLSFIFIEIFILYRSILYNGASFSEFNPSFYTIYFLGAFFIFFLQIFVFFNLKYQKYTRQINISVMLIRVIYFLILINISDVYDSIPGILICIFLSIIYLPLIRLDILFGLGLLMLILVAFREFNLMGNVKPLQNDSTIKKFSVIHIILSHIEISFLFFITFLLQKRNYEEIERKNFQVSQTLTQATSKMKDTLSILLPRFIREKLYSGQNYDKISTNQGNVAVLFCDITNFDEIMMQEEEKIVKVLDSLFRQFDKSCQSNQVLKIETVGKTYMAAAGLRDVDEYYQDGQNTINSFIDPVKRCLQVAMEMLETAKNTTWGNTASGGKSGKVEIKIGINYGTVISGVIGFHKPQFSLIGDTVNTASRVCSTGSPKTINISASSFQRVCQLKLYKFQARQVEAKGKGIITTYVVTQKNTASYNHMMKKKMLQQDLMLQKELINKLHHPTIKIQEKIVEQSGQSSNNENSTSQPSKDTPNQEPATNGVENSQEKKIRLQRKRSGTYYMDSISKFGLLRMVHDNENLMSAKTKTQFHSSEKIINPQTMDNIVEVNQHKHGTEQASDQKFSSNNNVLNKSPNNSSNNLNKGFRGRLNSIFLATSNQNIINLHEESIEPIHQAEQYLGIEHKIDIQKLQNHGLNLQYYDFKTIKMQYQEEKDDISQGKQNHSNRLTMSYWRGKNTQKTQSEMNYDFDDALNDFWSSQMDDTFSQINGALKLTFLQIFLYTLTLFLMIGPSKFNIIIVIRCILLIAIITIYFLYKIIFKASTITLNKCRLYVIVFYFIIFSVLNVELWLATPDTAQADSDYYLYNDHEMREIINVLIYEIYLIYFLFFRLRIFIFVQQFPVFIISFIVMMVHNIIDGMIFESIVFKVIFLQLTFTLSQHQLFQKDQENFNTIQSLNEKNQQTDKLIQYLLPSHILQRFLMNPTASYIIAEKFDKQTILFADIAGFTRYSDQNQPETVVKMLRTIFTEFDQKCQHHKVFKVYTIGDCYVILGNTNHENRDPPTEAYNVIMMAFQMIEILSRTTELVENQIDMRIGVHTGKIVGGLVGTQIVRYDIYGVDVMIANKMESNGQKGCVVVSETTKEILQERYDKEFIFTEKGDVYIKAIDTSIKTYFCDKNPL